MRRIILLVILMFVHGVIQAQGNIASDEDHGDVSVIKFDHTGESMAVGYDLGKVEIWNLKNEAKQPIGIQTKIDGRIISINFIDEINQLMIVYEKLGIVFLDPKNASISKLVTINFNEYLKDEPERLIAADYNSDKGILGVAGNIENRIVLVDVKKLYLSETNSSTNIYSLNTREWRRIFPHPDESSLVLSVKGDEKKDPAIFKDLLSDMESVQDDSKVITCVKLSPSLKYALAGTKDGKIIKWNITEKDEVIYPEKILPIASSKVDVTYKDLLDIDCTDTTAVSVSFGNDRCGQFQLWDASDLSLIYYTDKADGSTCRKINLNGDFAVTTGDYSYRLWKKQGDEYILIKDIVYVKSVGYLWKTSCVDFYKGGLLAVGDHDNVFFYDFTDFKYLYNLKGTKRGLKELVRDEQQR